MKEESKQAGCSAHIADDSDVVGTPTQRLRNEADAPHGLPEPPISCHRLYRHAPYVSRLLSVSMERTLGKSKHWLKFLFFLSRPRLEGSSVETAGFLGCGQPRRGPMLVAEASGRRAGEPAFHNVRTWRGATRQLMLADSFFPSLLVLARLLAISSGLLLKLGTK